MAAFNVTLEDNTIRVQVGENTAAAAAFAALSQAWAESATAPGGAGTKSAKTWATEAEVSADDAAQSAAYAGGFEVPEYASQSAGNAATTPGQIFRVPLGTTPQTFNWFRRLVSGSELVDPLATSSALLAPGGAGRIGKTGGGTLQNYIDVRRINVKDAPYNAAGTGLVDDAPAFAAAIAALPATGGTIVVPDSAAYRLDSTVATGTKPVVFEIGHTRIICPRGDHGIRLQANGSGVRGAGKWATIFQHRAPVSPMVYPTIALTINGSGAVNGSTITGGSGMRSCPVAICSNSPAQAITQNPDCGLVLTQAGGTVSLVDIVAPGTGYTTAPTVTLLGGAQAAVMIDNVQGCDVRGFSVDFQNVPGTVGVYHRGGWWCHVQDIDVFYNVATGVMSEHSTSIGLVVDSYTLGVPGANGAFGGVYICSYSNIHFTKRALIGHDTSTGTTFNFNRCDFKNSFIHGCVDILDLGIVAQAPAGHFYDLINVDTLTLVGGDFESTAGWFRFIGSCSNIRCYNVLTFSASGTPFRGQPGSGSFFDFAKLNAPESLRFPVRYGSLNAGGEFQNTGWNIRHGYGVTYSGDTWIASKTNITPISATQGTLGDTSAAGIYTYSNSSGQFGGRMANAGTNPVTTFDLFRFDVSGLDLLSGSYRVAGTQVVGARGAAVADATGGTTVDAEARTAINTLLARLRSHGLIAS